MDYFWVYVYTNLLCTEAERSTKNSVKTFRQVESSLILPFLFQTLLINI